MAGPIEKFLSKVSKKDRAILSELIKRISSGDLAALDVKKLAGSDRLFRVRKGAFRIVFEQLPKDARIVLIDRRPQKTYRDF